ncbi:hypothetical protein RHGRI_030555 [Rhododendron griersonianum]|uniref:Uncharacterized protein n=1 Tax=Rhododendron griersonianum TaxID=479676 RepID=A0AAV6INH9_9ERIC|nr:hypothetical protein RHGRI_030555 [Rhododendron griersonianum]
MKAHSWPRLQNNPQQPEESHAPPVPVMPDNQTPGSECSVNNANNQNYQWLRDEVIELVRILKSTAIGNRLLTDALQQNTTLSLLRQCI